MRRLLAWLATRVAPRLLAGCAAARPCRRSSSTRRIRRRTERVPVILIPGLLGSRLARAENGVELWPGGTRKLLTSDYEELALRIDPETLEPIDDGLVPSGIFEGAAGKDFYRRSCRSCARQAATGSRVPASVSAQERARLYVFTYDWRQDNVKTVRKLDELIEQIRRDYDDPSPARGRHRAQHGRRSSSRYYERYGTVDVLDGNSFRSPASGSRSCDASCCSARRTRARSPPCTSS